LSRVSVRLQDAQAGASLTAIHRYPGERNNLWGDRRDVVKQLLALLEKYQGEGRSVPVHP